MFLGPMSLRNIGNITAIGLLLLVLTACASTPKDPTKDWTAQRFYTEAKEAMAAGNYETAIKQFEGLEARFPYGRYAEQAQLEVAYAYYKNSEPELAISAAERFIRLHPTHPNTDYAYYLKGLVHFNDKRNFLGRMFGIGSEISNRDPKASREAYKAFRDLIERFPHSRYARDASLRINYLYNAMAEYEIKVARFYYERDAYVAAVNRCKYVLENYQRTAAVEHALGIQAQAYNKMGLQDLKQDSLRVLQANYPNSRYLKKMDAVAALPTDSEQ